MAWEKGEIKSKFIIKNMKYDSDFERINGEWCRTNREEVQIDCDALKDKKDLNDHDKYALNICNSCL